MKQEIKKPLEILVVEDCKFASGENFLKRLAGALREKGYSIYKINIKDSWTPKDESLLSNYDVIVSDLGFPTDYHLSKEEISDLVVKNKEKLKECSDKMLNSEYVAEVVKRGFEKYYKDPSFIIDCIHKRGDYGFLPIGLQAKKQNKKVSFYTEDPPHAMRHFVLGLGAEIFNPKEIVDLLNAYKFPGVTVSENKRLMIGEKQPRLNVFPITTEGEAFNNWYKVLETAIKYQTK
jgi:hypothetical protein